MEKTLTSNPEPFLRAGALLGVDFGEKRLGFAVSNFEQTVAMPLETYVRRTPALDSKFYRTIAGDYRIAGIVVGLPLFKSGDESPQCVPTRAFGEDLATQLGVPVAFFDERHSSTKAELLLWQQGLSAEKRNARIDKLAAQLILQDFLDSRTNPPVPVSPPVGTA